MTSLRQYGAKLARALRARMLRGDAFECRCCEGHFRAFLPFGTPPRENAQCPGCGSLERHRLLWLYLKENTDLFRTRTALLYFAPEEVMQRLLRSLPNVEFLSADLVSSRAMVQMDITNIPRPDASFDAIIASHVLEHVPDDHRAMRELYRVLKPGGWAILQSPVRPDLEHTFEDPSVTDPAERERLFGNYDHVRWYGRDYSERLSRAGFEVKVDPYVRETLSEEQSRRYGLMLSEDIYFCRKPAR